MIDLNKIYNDNCLEGMTHIPDGSIDAIICDLPYGTTRNSWDSVIPLDQLWNQYKRIIKHNGAIVLFSQQPFTSILVASNPSAFKYEWIWQKESGTGFLNSKYAPLKIHENICVFGFAPTSYTPKSVSMVYNPQKIMGKPYKCKSGRASRNYDAEHTHSVITESDGERFPTDIINFSRDKIKIHPTQKPVDLLRYLIRTYTNEGDIVLDNCMGSGTTAIACIREKRNFIGFEINTEYYFKSLERIKKEYSEPTLF